MRIRLLCFLLLLPFVVCARGESSEEFFVKVLSDKDRVVQGDSCLLSVVLYASHPFEVKKVPAKVKAKNGSLRALPVGRQRLQQVVENHRYYYALVVGQYVARTEDVGDLVFPETGYVAVMHIQEAPADPFDAFFGRRAPVRKVEVKAKNEKFRLPVVEKPRRTMLEMRQSGLQVL